MEFFLTLSSTGVGPRAPRRPDYVGQHSPHLAGLDYQKAWTVPKARGLVGLLRPLVPKVMTVHKTSAAAEVIRSINTTMHKRSPTMPPMTLQSNGINVERAEFRLLTDYANTMHKPDPDI